MLTVLLRAIGRVVRVDAREGVSRAGKNYRIPFVVLLVEDQGVAEINVSDVVEATTEHGDLVDWLVEVSAFAGTPQARYVANIASASALADVPDPSFA